MAYREVARVEIGEVIRLWQAGEGLRRIATGTGLSRATAQVCGRIARGGPEATEEQLSRLAASSHSGPRDRLQVTPHPGVAGGAGLPGVVFVPTALHGPSGLAAPRSEDGADGRPMARARVENSVDRTFGPSSPDLLILDDLGLRRLTSADLYDPSSIGIGSAALSSPPTVPSKSGLSLFDDPILGNSALDRLANTSYQIVIEVQNYRERFSPYRAFSRTREAIDPPSAT